MSGEWRPGDPCGRACVAVDELLHRAAQLRQTWIAPDLAASAAQTLEGIAHDSVCGCEDSTVAHLADWLLSVSREGAETR